MFSCLLQIMLMSVENRIVYYVVRYAEYNKKTLSCHQEVMIFLQQMNLSLYMLDIARCSNISWPVEGTHI